MQLYWEKFNGGIFKEKELVWNITQKCMQEYLDLAKGELLKNTELRCTECITKDTVPTFCVLIFRSKFFEKRMQQFRIAKCRIEAIIERFSNQEKISSEFLLVLFCKIKNFK